MLTYKELSIQEAKAVYNTYLLEDFPPLEVKPFRNIARLMEEGRYRSIGFYENEELVGYAFFCDHRDGAHSLWDYFAIRSNLRGQGYGQRIIEILRKIHENYEFVMLESENPEYARDEEDLAVRRRRLHFYEKSGLVYPGLTSRIFDVDYVVLTLDSGPEADRVRKYYEEIYRDLVSESHFTQKVHIN